ncbi:MAG: DUF1080 domain-containing protein [Tunicatimonas sp.]
MRFVIVISLISLATIACQTTTTTEETTATAEAPVVTTADTAPADNTLTDQEKAEGWELLFDGTSTDHWRGAHKENFPEGGWTVEDGMLVVESSDGAESQNGGDIVTNDEYSNFVFQTDFKLTEGANSGIKYFVTEAYNSDKSAIGLEYQLLDDERHPDAKLGNNGGGTRTLASLYDLKGAPTDKPAKPIGEWNTARLEVNGKQVTHYLNGTKVLEYERGSDAYHQLVQGSKYKDWDNFGMAESGHLLLQDHGDRVYFKNIKVRKLSDS